MWKNKMKIGHAAVAVLLVLAGCTWKSQKEKIGVATVSLPVDVALKEKIPDIPIDFDWREDIGIKFHDIYSMKMKQSSYPAHFLEDFEAVLYNHSGPDAMAGLHYELEYMKPPCWMEFPFIDNLIFADIGFPLNVRDTLDFVIRRNLFKNRFEAGNYRVSTGVLVELFAEFDVVSGALPVKQKAVLSRPKPFELAVSSVSLQNDNDSIIFTIRNNSDLPICLSMYPTLLDKNEDGRFLQIDLPVFQGMTAPVAHEIRRLTKLAGGTSMSFSVPVHWDSDSVDPRKKELFPGHYFCRQLIQVELSAEFSYGK